MIKLGKTGDFPDGKSRDDDEGGLTFAVANQDGLVGVYFGTPVAWFSMPPSIARQLAETLMQHADMIESQRPAGVRPEPPETIDGREPFIPRS